MINLVSDADKSNGSHGNVNHEPRAGKPPKPHRSISWSQLLLPSYKTRLAEFRKLFAKHVPTNERLIADFSCALQREILIQGRLYLSVNYLSFHANIFGWETVVSIKLAEVTALTKTNTIRVIPNAMQIIMDSGQKYIFTSFVARDKAFKRVYRLWQDVVIGQKMSVSEVWELIHYNYGNDLGVPSDDSEPDDDEELSIATRNNMNIVEEELIDDDVFDGIGLGPHRRLRLPMASGGDGEHQNVVDEKVLDSLRQLADITTRLVSSKAFTKLA
ncbi:unnamed protein product [Medioppia subpectinata]|uniref:GRAM domain-containing protein n=1 Tax=Medioppia subpectinata TaxID=1979941 RepID=A0A7R9KKR2_9ACAR|nr:unnamed protein product [Medioppia subpectinata]CAG2105040.1 unnamed protein product [Medioppia subpectinata]